MLHVQVAEELRSEISTHQLPPGALLPSEAVLQHRFGVSRSVVRQALGTLAAEGLVSRIHGRGTVVAQPVEHHRLVSLSTGLFTQLAAAGLVVTTRVLTLSEEAATGRAMQLGTSRVLRLERVRTAEGRPVAVIKTSLALPACDGLTIDELTDASLHEVLSSRFGLRATGGRRQIRAVAADARLASLLDTRPGAPLLLLEGMSTDQQAHPLEVFATWHRADEVAFDVDMRDTAAQEGGPAAATRDRLQELDLAARTARQLAFVLGRLARE